MFADGGHRRIPQCHVRAQCTSSKLSDKMWHPITSKSKSVLGKSQVKGGLFRKHIYNGRQINNARPKKNKHLPSSTPLVQICRRTLCLFAVFICTTWIIQTGKQCFLKGIHGIPLSVVKVNKKKKLVNTKPAFFLTSAHLSVSSFAEDILTCCSSTSKGVNNKNNEW